MLKTSDRFATNFDCNNNALNFKYESFKNIYSRTVLLPTRKNKRHNKIDNLKIINGVQSKVLKQQTCIPNKMSTRKIPNILKNNFKLQRISEVLPMETNTTIIDTKQNSSTMPDSSFIEKKCIRKKSKHKKASEKRKQEYKFNDIWYGSTNWASNSCIDDRKKMLQQNLFTSVEVKDPMQKEILSNFITKQYEEHEIPVFKTDYKYNLLSPTLHNISKEFIPEFRENSIDFSNNEIFSNFNYESYGINNLDYLTNYTVDSDKMCHSLNTIHDHDIYKKKCDVNSNKVDIYEIPCCSLIQDKQNDEEALSDQSLMFSKCCNENTLFLNDKKPNCLSELCCDYCPEECASHWVSTTKLKNEFNKNSITMNNDIDNQVNLNCSNSQSVKTDVYLTDVNLKERYSAKNSCSLTTDIESLSHYPLENPILSLDELSTFYNDTDIKKEVTKEMKNNNCTDTLLIEENKKYNPGDKEFQCSLCPITFSTISAMSIHHAKAHGGSYLILCESCGRLFNQKYQFKRHFIYCNRMEEPYKCDMCTRMYRHKSSLIHHLKLVHHIHYANNHSATFACNICKKIYSKFGAFETHMKQHKTV
ncbi:uncharacterized protein LOC143150156 isoform X2 [Ptiloglossa arizonensis]